MLKNISRLILGGFKPAILCGAIFSCVCYAGNTYAQLPLTNGGAGNLNYIDPLRGNVGALLQPTRPTVQLPNQMIRMAPDRGDYIDDQISGFPLNIVSHRLGQVFALKAWDKPVNANAWKEKQTYDHDLEVTRPWYYSTYLIDDDITV